MDAPYLTTPEAAAYLRMSSARALIVFRSRHGGPQGYRRGNRLLFTKDQLDEWMGKLAETRKAAIRVRPTQEENQR
jgi:hypothetical protein